YFQYFTRSMIQLSRAVHPREIYQALFNNIHTTFYLRFNQQFNIEGALSLVAYNAIDRGEEAFPISEFLRILKTSLEAAGLIDIDTRDITNWLVSSSILIPYSGNRIAFVHQSVTEYLAANELARRYQDRPYILKEK